MKVLTVITTIFMPLTFIAGIYGMNFEHMPELTWKYGYYGAILLMFVIGMAMYLFFLRKGWFK
jgi:magnesium transporter